MLKPKTFRPERFGSEKQLRTKSIGRIFCNFGRCTFRQAVFLLFDNIFCNFALISYGKLKTNYLDEPK